MAAPDPLPSLELQYENLSLTIHVPVTEATHPKTVRDVIRDTLLAVPNRVLDRFKAVGDRTSRTKPLKLIDRISGRIKPGRMTLVLGHPGSGKTTLLKALTGRLVDPRLLKGEVKYNGLSAAEITARGIHLAQLVQYIPQLDEHSPFLTVRETLRFIASNALAGVDAAGAEARVQETLALLRLQDCANTVIGNTLLRGISGGEMKRVTIGEGLLTNARFLALDEVSTGLDATVTLQIMRALQARCRTGVGVVVALLQATPEAVALFDDVIVLREGALVYHGSLPGLPVYLRGLGFFPPNLEARRDVPVVASATPHPLASPSAVEDVNASQCAQSPTDGTAAAVSEDEDEEDLADWVAAWVTYPARRHREDVERLRRQQQSDARASAGVIQVADLGAATTPPFSTPALVSAWQSHCAGIAPLEAAGALNSPSHMEGIVLSTDFARLQFGRAHAHASARHLWLLLQRQLLLNSRNRLFLVFRLANALVMGLIIAAMYYQQGIGSGLNLYGLFLNTVMFLSFANMSEMSATMSLKIIAYRQTGNGSYPSWTFPLAIFIAQLPVAALEASVFGAWLYFMSGLTLEAGRFFFYLLVAFLSDIFAGTLFRCFALGFPTLEAAQTGPMPIIALLVVFAGFLILPSKMGWLQFVYLCNPYAYAIKSLAQNEFSADRYNNILPTGQTLGESYLSYFDMPTDLAYKWGGVGFLLGVTAILLVCNITIFYLVRFDNNIGSARHLADDESDKSLRPPVLSTAHVTLELPLSVHAAPLAFHDDDETHHHELPVVGSHVAVAAASTALPFAPASVAFRNVTYTVKLRGGAEKTLLHRVSGFALPGRMLALMGASGAGKTTLLDVLAGRKNSGKMTGDVFLRGRPKDPSTFNRLVAYCEQQDIHNRLTTVREALHFSARLRLSTAVSPAKRTAYVAEVLRLLELEPIADRLVGVPGAPDALAPGERKRLTIGVELCANTPVLFLDEPTSGLDARAAAVVVRTLRNVASTGRTIICTVHQPSHEIFSQFDDLLLLQRGGWLVYSGRLGHNATTLVRYLQALPGVQPAPPEQNAATWMLDVLAASHVAGATPMGGAMSVPVTTSVAAEHGGTPQGQIMDSMPLPNAGDNAAGSSSCAPVASLPAAPEIMPQMSRKKRAVVTGALLSGENFQTRFFDSVSWQKQGSPQLELACVPIVTNSASPGLSAVAESCAAQTPSALVQYSVLANRELLTARRDAPFNLGRIGSLIFLNLLFGTIYYRIAFNANDVAGLQSLVAGIYMTTVFAAMINLNLVLPGQIKARAVFYRETSAALYSPWPYVAAVLTAEVPWLAVACIMGPSLAYFMLGLSPDPAVYFVHLLAVYLMALAYGLLAMAAANSLPTFEVAQALVSSLAAILMLYGGIFGKISQMPVGSRWVNTIDPVGYMLRVVLPLHIHCEGGAAAGCPKVAYPTPQGVIQVDRSALMNSLYDVYYVDVWINMLWLALFVPGLFLANALAMRFIRHSVR